MKTNTDARVWCSENYNSSQEAFYIFNAKKLIVEEWRIAWMHALTTLFIAIAGFLLGLMADPLVFFASTQIGFLMYGILTYSHNDQGAGMLAYASTLIFWTKYLKEVSEVVRTVYIVVGIVLFVCSFITEINYKKVLGSYTQTAQRQWANDEEEFEAWKRKYYTGYSRDASYSAKQNNSSKTNDYQNDTHQTYDNQRPTGIYAEKAQALFADYGTTYNDLKKKYRKLAMTYHPDRGGEHDMFVAIVAEYEYLKETRFPNEK